MTKEQYTEYFGPKINGRIEVAIAPSVAEALASFCNQEPEFEQAIFQSGKTFQDCLSSISKGVGNSISDIEVYGRAVKFYFETATVSFHMSIDLSGSNGAEKHITMTESKPETESKALDLSLDDLLDF